MLPEMAASIASLKDMLKKMPYSCSTVLVERGAGHYTPSSLQSDALRGSSWIQIIATDCLYDSDDEEGGLLR